MRAGWWWIDRWRKSTAYTDMTAEQQGVYRNLLDELWLREGTLPLSEKALAQISGDYEAWPRVREVVLARFRVEGDGLVHIGETFGRGTHACRWNPSGQRHRRHIPLRVRRAVMERDGKCVLCGSASRLELDHIDRYRDGGTDVVENLRVLCMPCNRRRA